MAEDYSTIENPFDSSLNRINNEADLVVQPFIGSGTIYGQGDSEITSPNQISSNVIDGNTLDNLWIKSWIKSNEYLPGVQGFKIDGITGNVEFGDGFFRGDITGASGTFSGSISATSGLIGGWTINATSITDTTGATGLSSAVTVGDDIRFWAGNVTPASAPFRVTEAGSLVATSAIIAGWTIDSTTISSASNEVVLDSANKKITVGTSAELVIDGDNKNISSSNYISGYAGSGFYLDSDLLEVGNIAARGIIRTAVFQKDVISAVGGNVAILDADVLDTDMTALDASTLSIEENTTFSIGDILRIKDGLDDEWLEVLTSGEAICDSYSEAYLEATTTFFTGGGSQMSGQSFTGDGNVLSSCRFALSITTGSPTGNATATIYAHTGTFGTDGVPTGSALATSGTFDVSTLTSEYQVIAFTFTGAEKITLVDGTNYFVILEYPGGDTSNRLNQGTSTPNVLAPGNAAYFKTAGVWTATSWDRIFYVYTEGVSNPYTVTRDKAGDYTADNNPAWTKGAAVVNYGQSGDGGVYMTASDSNAPYISIFDHAGSPWTTINTRLRLGNLNGYLGYSTDKYGIAIGETDKYLKYDTTNGLRVKGDVTLTGGEVSADYLTAGTITSKTITLAVAAGTGDSKVQIGKTDFGDTTDGLIFGIDDSVAGDPVKFEMGDANYYMSWDAGDLTIRPKYSNLQLYETVVDAAGHGDYTTLSAAVTAGKTKIFVRDGSYSNASITLLSDTNIIGESKEGVVLDVNFTINGATVDDTNTVTATNNSTTITGSSTSWDGLVNADDILFIDEQYYYVSTVDSDTQITLKEKFFGTGGAGLSYEIIRPKSNIEIRNVTLTNTSGRIAEINYTDDIYIHDCMITTTGTISDGHFYSGNGHNYNFNFSNNIINYSTGGVIWIDAQDFKINDNVFKHSGYSNSASSTIYCINLDDKSLNGTINNNVISPFYNEGVTSSSVGIGISGKNINIIGNIIDGGDRVSVGIHASWGATYCVIQGNNIKRCTEGIQINSADYFNVNGNIVSDCTTGIYTTASSDYNIITSNQCYNNTANILDYSRRNILKNNIGSNINQERDISYMKNTSGGSIAVGDLVTLKSVAAGNEVTTTTAQGDDDVFGMSLAIIANNDSGYIQTLGITYDLKVDGTTDIAVGDFIGSFTSAGIGMKAASGDMAIAKALEVYTTDDSSGVIDALLMTPRKI